jgi:hypothetical protein
VDALNHENTKTGEDQQEGGQHFQTFKQERISKNMFAVVENDFLLTSARLLERKGRYTDKKEKLFPHILYKEIQKGAVAKSYMTNGPLIYDQIYAHFPYIRKPFFIYDLATAPI